MPDFTSSFTPALPKPGSWSVNDNKFDTDGKNPKQLMVFLPLESVYALAQHLMTLAETPDKVKEGSTYNYKTQDKEKVKGIYLNFNGKEGETGAFGSINPAKIAQCPPF